MTTPALASLSIENRMQADTTLVEGPRFYGYGSGSEQTFGASTNWEGAVTNGLVVSDEGALELGRAGLAEPTSIPWWDTSWTARSCGVVGTPAEPEPTTTTTTSDTTTTTSGGATTTASPSETTTGGDATTSSSVAPSTTTTTGATTSTSSRRPTSTTPADSTSTSPNRPTTSTTAAASTTTSTTPADSTSTSPDRPTTTTTTGETTTTTVEDESSATQLWSIEIDSTVSRVASGLSDLRVVDNSTGALVPHNILGSVPSTATEILVEADAPGASLCAYWGNPGAGSVEDESLRAPLVTDQRWQWERWNGAGNGLSLDLVDWSSPDEVSTIGTASVPADVCQRCAAQLSGTITAPVTGSYVFHLAADEVGRLELSSSADPALLSTVVEIAAPIGLDDFTDPSGASAPIDLIEGVTYAIRARSKDLTGGDHLQIAWSVDGADPELLPPPSFSDGDGTPEQLTLERFFVVETADHTTAPDEIFAITESETAFDSCDLCRHRIGGYVLIETAGSYRFWLSSDDEGTLELATSGDPGAAITVAWTPTFGPVSTWDTFASQGSAEFELAAEQVIWLEARSRDAGGPDHLQVGWSQITTDPTTGNRMEGPVDLIPTTRLATAAPEPQQLDSVAFAAAEGLRELTGTVVSPVIDTTAIGSGIHGLVEVVSAQPEGTAITARLAFADDPSGPWVASGPERDPGDGFITGDPVPLIDDGRRYARFEVSLSAADRDRTPSLVELGLEHDLTQLGSNRATTTVSASGDEHVIRVKGTAGPGATTTLEVLPAGTLVGLTATAWIAPLRSDQVVVDAGVVVQGVGPDTAFSSGTGQHLGVDVDSASGGSELRVRWVARSSGGALVTHDFVIGIDP